MFFTRSFIAALLSAVAYANSDANPFKNPAGGRTASAGQPLVLEWTPTTEGTVSLTLRSGSSGNLDKGTPIATGIQNNGSYTWNVPSDIVRGSDYTVEIVSDSDSTETNFTPQFVINSSNTTPASTSAASSGASSAVSTKASSTSNIASATNTESSASATDSSENSTVTTGTTSSSTPTGNATSNATATGPVAQTGAASRATAAAGFLGVVALGALAL